ncbi:hypothetical protein SDC9_116241 [bioreactor metagenome]|uniref:Uncharacterized protein n=1 Tax=bioreactor metagenome TaxID=1076179 RepID=A0A645BV08_9ZZZZ
MHLHAQAGHFQAHFGAEALDQRHQEFVERGVVGAYLRVGMMVGRVIRSRAGQRHGAATFHVGAHGHQHAAHIGVVNDGGAALHRAIDGAALHALLGVGHGVLVGAVGHGNALHANGVACRVHHDEHVFQATVFLAHQIADGTAMVTKLQHGRGRCLDAHLVLDGHAVHVVAITQRAVLVDQELGHNKQADALHALGRTGHAGQHQVDDVVHHIVLAIGDENLGAEHLVGAIGLRLGLGAHQRQIGAGLRLGQVHRAGPLTGHELFKIGRLQLIAASSQQRFDGTIGQQRAQRKAQVGAVEHLDAGRADGLGQALAAKVHRVLQALPAAFGVLLEGVLEARRSGDHAVLP